MRSAIMPMKTITALMPAIARVNCPLPRGAVTTGASVTPGMSTPWVIAPRRRSLHLLGERQQLGAILVLVRVVLPHRLGDRLPLLERRVIEVGYFGALLG